MTGKKTNRKLAVVATGFLLFAVLCAAQEKKLDWVQVTPNAGWAPRDSHAEFVYKDQIWIMGGWDTPKTPNFLDVWHSKNGKTWTELKSDVIWSPRHEHSALVFKDKLWVAAGAAEPDYKLNSEVWSLAVPRDWFK